MSKAKYPCFYPTQNIWLHHCSKSFCSAHLKPLPQVALTTTSNCIHEDRDVTRGSKVSTIPRAPNHYGAKNDSEAHLKVPTMSQVLSSIHHICFRKTLGSNMGGAKIVS